MSKPRYIGIDISPTLDIKAYHPAGGSDIVTADDLRDAVSCGYMIVSWEATKYGLQDLLLEDIALKHIDLAYHVLCLEGFSFSLSAVLMSHGLPPEEKVWRLIDDVSGSEGGWLSWRTRSGSVKRIEVGVPAAVEQLLGVELPRLEWMKRPVDRVAWDGWLRS